MIRIITIASLTVLLILVLYLPSAQPPERFVAQLRIEHSQAIAFWTPRHAERILTRTLDAHALASELSPVPGTALGQDQTALRSAVGNEMSAVNARLFNSQYFRSIDALLVLASYRIFTLLEWLPWLAPFCIAALVDGAVKRATRSKQFIAHDPEMFALWIGVAIMVACGTVVAFIIPLTLPPILLPAVPGCLAIFTAGALSNFHRRD
jgi:Domain of unknown function (DUF4400)